MSRDVHNGPTDQHHQARGEPYSGDPSGGEGTIEPEILKLPLDSWHRGKGARMVPFAGYEMPVQYEGIIAEHQWTRENAGLFDVSHMGQLYFSGEGVDEALEALLPADVKGVKLGRMRYSLLLADNGGIFDDLMLSRWPGGIYMVVNGATKWDDIAHLREHLPDEITLNHMEERALLALQGPRAFDALARHTTGQWDLDVLGFMMGGPFQIGGAEAWISRSGYTGEDGFEISVDADKVATVAELLCGEPEVKPVGLGARDSLRLEAGLPLYGHDLDPDTTPAMADLGFAIGKRRREEGGFPGSARILEELKSGAMQKRVGLDVEGRQPVREGARILDGEGNEVGRVTSGGFSPSLGRPIAMGYVATHLSDTGTALKLEQRSKLFEARVAPMPFIPHRYHRKGA
ncbi:MAG: glycine cleavage system aminomethyltransferase GcvT [Sphingomicrobium sp.]